MCYSLLRKRRNVKLSLLLSLFLISCGGAPKVKPTYTPAISFEEEFTHYRKVNLSKKLGDSFLLGNEGDTMRFAVNFYPDERENEIIQLGQGVIFKGTATTYKGMIFLNEEKDSTYLLSALLLEKDFLRGLVDRDYQYKALDQAYESNLLGNLVEDNEEKRVLPVDKKAIHDVFSSILIELNAWEHRAY